MGNEPNVLAWEASRRGDSNDSSRLVCSWTTRVSEVWCSPEIVTVPSVPIRSSRTTYRDECASKVDGGERVEAWVARCPEATLYVMCVWMTQVIGNKIEQVFR